MASITKQPNGDYKITVSLGKDENGKYRREYAIYHSDNGLSEAKNRKAAKKAAEELEEKLKSGFPVSSKATMKMDDWFDTYLRLKKTEFSPNTYDRYKKYIDEKLRPYFGKIRLNEVKPLHIQMYINDILIEKEHLSPASISRYYTIIQSVFSTAVRLQIIRHSPASGKAIIRPKVPEPNIKCFDQKTAAKMLECLETEPIKWQAYVNLALITGLRRGEMVALKWEDIDFERRIVHVMRAGYKITGQDMDEKLPKDGEHRDISVTEHVLELLDAWRTVQKQNAVKVGDLWQDHNYIFTQLDGRMMGIWTPDNWWTKFLKRHDLPHIKLHGIRHTSATLSLIAGVDIKTVSGRLGHASIDTTNKYLHYLQAADVSAADSLDQILKVGK